MERAKSAHLAVLVVIMSAAEEELERLLVAEDGGPRERGIPLVVRIRVAYVRPLDQTFDEKEIILCATRRSAKACTRYESKTHLLQPGEGGLRRPSRPWLEDGDGGGREDEHGCGGDVKSGLCRRTVHSPSRQ